MDIPTGRSLEFGSFYDSYFGDPYMAWHDGLDEDSLLSLQGEERELAERLLIEAADTGDSRAAAGLASLRSQAATPMLKERLPRTWGTEQINIALALWRTERYQPAIEALISNLKNGPDWSIQMDAAIALAHVRVPEAVAALLDVLDDEDELVRHHSAASLLTMHGITGQEEQEQWSIGVMMTDHRRDEAIAGIKNIIAEHKLLDKEA